MNKVKNRVGDLEVKIFDIENEVTANKVSLDDLNESLEGTKEALSIALLELQVADEENAEALQEAINEGNRSYSTLIGLIQALQSQTTILLIKQAALELEDRVVAIYDPCPLVSSTSFKESFFLMSSGRYVAYFEDGNRRFLSVLKTGVTYRTTDARACIFTL
jgi:hypothetical protein